MKDDLTLITRISQGFKGPEMSVSGVRRTKLCHPEEGPASNSKYALAKPIMHKTVQ